VRVFHGFSQVGDSYYKVIPLAIQNMGQIPLSQSIETKTWQSHLFRMWTWCAKMGLGMKAKTRWQLNCIHPPCSCLWIFARWTRGYANCGWMEHPQNLSLQQDVKKPMIKNHLGHTWYGFKTYKPFPLVISTSFRINHFCVFWFDWIFVL
jgi:hypothetical protein